MTKQSAGILLYRINSERVEVLLLHPGGPFWAKKDEHAWSIPKGETGESEDLLTAAKREFTEETGWSPPLGELHELGSVKASSGKIVHIWAVEGDADVSTLKSQMIEIDWPPRSGRKMKIPEVDRAEWVSLEKAVLKLHKNQTEFIGRLIEWLKPQLPNLSLRSDTLSEDSKPEQGSLF